MTAPLVSCLCITEGRAPFMPWLLWGYDRQSWLHRELVIVDSSAQPLESPREDVRVLRADRGTSVPAKRNQALQAARGDFVAWFDDDDWQHPDRLRLLLDALGSGAPYASSARSWFLDVFSDRCRRYDGRRSLIFNSAVFRRELACSVDFDEKRKKASDTLWMRRLEARARGIDCGTENLTLWLCHEHNISNPRHRRALPHRLTDLLEEVDAEAWGDTGERLRALRARLPVPAGGLITSMPDAAGAESSTAAAADRRARLLRGMALAKAKGHAARSQVAPRRVPRRGGATTARGRPDVGLVLLATDATAPVLAHTVPHLVRQARRSFAERVAATGRNGSPALRETVQGLIDAEHVERWVQAQDPLVTALGEMRSPFVLVAPGAQLFCSGAVSWVDRAIDVLLRDDALLWVCNQAGPALGQPGSSRMRSGPRRNARWDPVLELWRQLDASDEAFVAERERLLAVLSKHPAPDEAPLSARLGIALSDEDADRGSLALQGSWALTATGKAFADYAPRVIPLLEAGRFPGRQRGQSIVDFDDEIQRKNWLRLSTPLGA